MSFGERDGLSPSAEGPSPSAAGPSPSSEPSTTLRRRAVSPTSPANDMDASGWRSEGSGSGKGNDDEEEDRRANEAKPLGKTYDGVVFQVPHTSDNVTSVFSPFTPKSPLDLLTILLTVSQTLLFLFAPRSFSRPFFLATFIFFRALYNGGLGYVLKRQSNEGWLVKWIVRQGWLDEKRKPKARQWLKGQLSMKMGDDYDFETVPTAYNTWLIFRSFVDVILVNDFVSYSLFAFAFTHLPAGHSHFLNVLRWVGGWLLIFFNLWVKMDAHRVVKDYAWYWGDCFFRRINTSLQFDGVYEIAPDPMYSIGYAGYYGLSMVSGSYTVLYVSLLAHASQFAFLVLFESPHIEKTYGSPRPLALRVPLHPNGSTRSESVSSTPADSPSMSPGPLHAPLPSSAHRAERRSLPPTLPATPSSTDGETATETELESVDADMPVFDDSDNDSPVATSTSGIAGRRAGRGRWASSAASAFSSRGAASGAGGPRIETEMARRGRRRSSVVTMHDLNNRFFRKDTTVVANLDLFRANDFLLTLLVLYSSAFIFLPINLSRTASLILFTSHAVAWRIFHSFVLGVVLHKQSESKWVVRHFLKHYYYEDSERDAVDEAWANWKVVYNASLVMTYVSFLALAWRCYVPISHDWTVGTELLRHTMGMLLIGLHVWASVSSYRVIGPAGWFYADFWLPDFPNRLYYTGIYRFVNNPERTMASAAFFGIVLISGSRLLFCVAVFSHLSHWLFLSKVENPHMKKLYGEAAIRRDAGITKQVKTFADRNARLFMAAAPAVKEVQGTFEKMSKDTSEVLGEFLVSKAKPRFEGLLKDTKTLLQQSRDRLVIVRVADDLHSYDKSKYALSLADAPASLAPGKPLRVRLGEPIRVRWRAAASHSRSDWIAIYHVDRFLASSVSSRLVTKISSLGFWVPIREDEWDGDAPVKGASGSRSGSRSGGRDVESDTEEGEVVFKGRRLPWQTGRYEIRYHHDSKHSVMAIAPNPIEIYVDKPKDVLDYDSVYSILLRIVTLSLDSDPTLAPRSAANLDPAHVRFDAGEDGSGGETEEEQGERDPDDFTIMTEEQARRISYGIEEAFDVEYDTEVIVAAANVAKLAGDVLEAKQVLSADYRQAPPPPGDE